MGRLRVSTDRLSSRYYAEHRTEILRKSQEARDKLRELEGRVKYARDWGPRPAARRQRKPLNEHVFQAPKGDTPRAEKDWRTWQERKQWAVDLLGGKCQRCGYNKCLAALEFDHRDPRTKRYNISDLMSRKWAKEVAESEIRKCDLLCANCHREKTYAARDTARGRSLTP